MKARVAQRDAGRAQALGDRRGAAPVAPRQRRGAEPGQVRRAELVGGEVERSRHGRLLLSSIVCATSITRYRIFVKSETVGDGLRLWRGASSHRAGRAAEGSG